MAKGRGRARERENAKSKLEKERETAMVKENVIVMRSGNSLVISEQRDETMAKEFSAKMKMPSLSRSLDVWLRLENKTLMCFSIPGITTTLNTLSSSSKCHHPHCHNFDETRRPLDTNYDIGTNSFPVILADFKGPFPLPGINDPLFCRAVVGHTLFVVGGDCDDLQGLFDIQTEGITTVDDPPTLTASYSSENCPWALNTSDNCFLDPYTHTTTLTSLVDDENRNGNVNSGFLPSDNLSPVTTASTDTTPSTNTTASTVTMPATPTTIPESSKEPSKGISHKIWTFDLRNPDLGWSQGHSLISPRIYPLLVPYQGKLYAFSGNHPSLSFAEVYDPISATWTKLPPAPFRSLPDSQMYVVPLKGWNKLWVFGVLRPVDYTYDVLTRKWQKFTGSRDILPYFTDRYDLVSALTPEKHMVVYWINELDVVYAYNLSTKQLFKGPISGTDFKEGSLGARFAFRHLRHDLFCLIGCTYLLDPVPIRTIVHVTLLQVSIKPLSKFSKPLELPKVPSKIDKKICKAHPLTAAVVACFAYPLKGEIGICDSYITYKNV